ncbi:MAG TPA: hypothetical protein PK581_04405 [Caldisericia bacterium]|nr:hypothetical protein [Caldisericia bacterium]
MMNRISIVLSFFVCFFVIFSGCNFSKEIELNIKPPEAQHLQMLFAESIDENKKPIGENFEFDAGQEFYIFFESNLPFGLDKFRVTIHQFDENNETEVYDQAELSIDQGWNTGFLPFDLPAGHYEIEVYFHDGLSAGREIIINE